jgi:hypothetical protein
MVGEMSSVLRELERVEDRLLSSTSAEDADKYALMTRLEELRTRAARLAVGVDEGCSSQELLIRLASLRRRRDLLDRQHGSANRRPQHPQHGSRSASQVDQQIERIYLLLAERGIRVR